MSIRKRLEKKLDDDSGIRIDIISYLLEHPGEELRRLYHLAEGGASSGCIPTLINKADIYKRFAEDFWSISDILRDGELSLYDFEGGNVSDIVYEAIKIEASKLLEELENE